MRKSVLWTFGLVVAAIVALGLAILSSASEASGLRLHGDSYYFMKRQFAYLVGGVLLATVASLVDYRRWRDTPILAWLFLGVVFLMLLAVFPPFGHRVNGSFRWINLGFFNIQPSEFAKLAVVVAVAVWIDRIGSRVELFWRGAMVPLLFIAMLAIPVVCETDFGSTVVIALVGGLIMLVGGVRFRYLIPIMILGAVGVAVRVLADPNRMARIAAWLGYKVSVGVQVASKAAENAEYQGRMALVAIGNGGIWGAGLGESMQKHNYLPEAHTDMIFAIGAEEFGLGFSLLVFFLFLAFFAICVHIAVRASDRFGRLLVVGMSFVIFFAAMFNMGVVCEALPMKGMALPFFSYGGTNMLCAFFAVGTILSVGIHSYRDRKRQLIGKVVMRNRHG